MNEMYRQGDILFIKSDVPIEGEKQESNVLIESNVTGHKHTVDGATIFFNEINWKNKFATVTVEKEAKIIHPEHKTLILPMGIYEVRRQREVRGLVND
jgi:hypothetical protein